MEDDFVMNTAVHVKAYCYCPASSSNTPSMLPAVIFTFLITCFSSRGVSRCVWFACDAICL